MIETTAVAKEQIATLCRVRRVRRLTWLDAPARTGPDAGEAALLVEFDPADLPPLSKLAAMEEEIGCILGRRIDLHLYLREMYLGCGPVARDIVYDRAAYMDIPMPQDKIAAFCQLHKIRWLAKLPRPMRSSVNGYADVDFLAEFEPDAGVGWDIYAMDDELSEMLGCLANIHRTGPGESGWIARLRETAEVQYERTH